MTRGVRPGEPPSTRAPTLHTAVGLVSRVLSDPTFNTGRISLTKLTNSKSLKRMSDYVALMPGRIFSVFDSYDAYGKSLPGMTLLIGGAFLLPDGSLDNIVIGQSFLNFIAVVISVVLIGSLIGEGVHTLAVMIESIFDFILRSLAWFRRYIVNIFNIKWMIVPPERDPHEMMGMRRSRRLFINLTDPIRMWVAMRRSALRFSLLGHRSIFGHSLEGTFERDPHIQRMKFAVIHAKNLARAGYGIDLEENALGFYPVAVSRLSETVYERSSKFQARYAFCRGMWVILFLVSIMYSGIAAFPIESRPDPLQYKSILDASVQPSQIWIIVLLLIFASLIFLNGVARYKIYNIEYLFIELFLHTTPDNHDEYVRQNRITD